MSQSLALRPRWRLAELIDFEMLVAGGQAADARDRQAFSDQIRPRLAGVAQPRRRALGLRLWLDHRRLTDRRRWAGSTVDEWLSLLRWLLFGAGMVLGAGVVWGLCLSTGQNVQVVIFIGLTVVVPWAGVLAVALVRRLAGRRSRGLGWLLARLLRPLADRIAAPVDARRWVEAVVESAAAGRAVAARASRLWQWCGLGWSVGAMAALLIGIMVFDVRFYWAATPNNEALMQRTVAVVAWPWDDLWPAAVPDAAQVRASRLRGLPGTTRAPGGAVADAWWRFLFMSLLVWGALPRALLIAGLAWRERAALSALDFQAARHRRLWRALAGVSRGAAGDAQNDEALVLDVGGHGIDGTAIRGFLLRRLRVNPAAGYRVNVRQTADEAAVDAELADTPHHVVLVALDWSLSPGLAGALHRRVRGAIGAQVPATWVIVGDADGRPVAPARDRLERWTAFIDGLHDPATEIAGYDPAA